MIDLTTIDKIIESWACKEGKVHETQEILSWIEERNSVVQVNINKIKPEEDKVWRYVPEKGIISNPQGTFFTISGYQFGEIQQPIIIQDEIGYLGLLCSEIDGVIHFLIQAKIEPGNINKVQLSPTIQATKSNFTQKHGGKKPPYLEYFLEAEKYEIIVDQIQSEQSARFKGKRNRNIVVYVPNHKDIEVLPSHKWVTLGQLKELMKYDNIVNMDTRTILSCIPMYLSDQNICKKYFTSDAFFKSVYDGDGINHLPEIFRYINNKRMFEECEGKLIPLESMEDWHWADGAFTHKKGYHFKIIFCDIAIDGREVKRWTQPLFEAVGMATFGLICCEDQGILKFLVKARQEMGSFDGPELSPTIQMEADEEPANELEQFFFALYEKREQILHDVILSEEGGRFYHEQNKNIILKADIEKLPQLPDGYFLLDYKTLNSLVQINNCLNIQLRNLLSLLEV